MPPFTVVRPVTLTVLPLASQVPDVTVSALPTVAAPLRLNVPVPLIVRL